MVVSMKDVRKKKVEGRKEEGVEVVYSSC